MPTITETGNPSNSLTTPGWTLADEFLPLVQIIPEKVKDASKNTFEIDGDELSDTLESVTLSEYIDNDKRTFTLQQLITTKKQLKLLFTIKKGSDDSDDEDGIVSVKLSTYDPKIKLTSKDEFKSSYGSEYSLELEMNPDQSTDFFVDFYAKDDVDDEYNEGELSEVHCGRIKIVFNIKTVCSDWPTIPSVIPVEKFIGWGHPGITKNCFDYVIEQLRVTGYKIKTESWRDWSKKELVKSDGIYQLFLEENIAGMTKGIQKKEFDEGVAYLKETLKKGIPIMAGVDDDYHKYNADKTTEHFITIVGMGEDENGKFFLFYDNASSNKIVGTSINNKLYCDCKSYKISGEADRGNTYLFGNENQPPTAKQKYTISQIRETK